MQTKIQAPTKTNICKPVSTPLNLKVCFSPPQISWTWHRGHRESRSGTEGINSQRLGFSRQKRVEPNVSSLIKLPKTQTERYLTSTESTENVVWGTKLMFLYYQSIHSIPSWSKPHGYQKSDPPKGEARDAPPTQSCPCLVFNTQWKNSLRKFSYEKVSRFVVVNGFHLVVFVMYWISMLCASAWHGISMVDTDGIQPKRCR